MTCTRQTLFGALQEDGITRFRLYAPACAHALLEIEGNEPITMKRRADGFHETRTNAPAGTRYRFRVRDCAVPDPASRRQAGGAHGWSVVTNDDSFKWSDGAWRGRAWEETVLYEAHAGLMGGFNGVGAQLEPLRDLGITAVELMPIATFPGTRNWGYDGVLPFAPAEAYGTPDELKALIDRAHALGLMMFLDVVYNHFGPDGNYLALYAPEFFRKDIQTPWGAAIDFRNEIVRRFFIENARYWIEEFRFDGLRFDAVHAIDPSAWLADLAHEVRESAGSRRIHLVLENDKNEPAPLHQGYEAQWNDDFHHILHVLLTKETSGYYADYAAQPAERLARVLSDGFDYQGQVSTLRGGARGAPSDDLPPTAFVSFLQNHDQVGNRAFGERLTVLADERALKAAIALHLLAPQIPLVFMGEEIGSRAPFLYFTDHGPKLAKAVRVGRAREFSFADEGELPDPNAEATFDASFPELDAPARRKWEEFYHELLQLRAAAIAPRLKGARAERTEAVSDAAVVARWKMADGKILTLAVNLGEQSVSVTLPRTQPLWGEADGKTLASLTTLAWLEDA
jgi:malto-oligosyltrehalose trehalohydrolase